MTGSDFLFKMSPWSHDKQGDGKEIKSVEGS